MFQLKLIQKWTLKFRNLMLLVSLSSYFYFIVIPIEALNETKGVKSSKNHEKLLTVNEVNLLTNKSDSLIDWVKRELEKNRTDPKEVNCIVDKLMIIRDMSSCFMDVRRIFSYKNYQREGPTLSDVYNKLEEISKMLSSNPGTSLNPFGMPFVIQNKAINGGNCCANKTT